MPENASALHLVLTGDPTLFAIVRLSLIVSLSATFIAALIGVPLGALIALTRFRGREPVIVMLNALMGLPPVVAGLAVYLMLSRSGPLGSWGLLFTPLAMVIAQTVLVTPIIAALARQTIEDLWLEYREEFAAMGVGPLRRVRTLIWDARFSLLTALLAGFGRAAAEVGAIIIVGGNLQRQSAPRDRSRHRPDVHRHADQHPGVGRAPCRRALLRMSTRAPATDLPIRFSEVAILAGGVTVLDCISITFSAGAPTVLIGPNGSGKTTLLRAAMGLIRPARGRITWDGSEVSPPTRRAIMFQRPVMLRRSAAANIGYALAAAGAPRAERAKRTAGLLSLVGLQALAGRPARQLSGGEQQRLSLARALARDPAVLFLDEPT